MEENKEGTALAAPATQRKGWRAGSIIFAIIVAVAVAYSLGHKYLKRDRPARASVATPADRKYCDAHLELFKALGQMPRGLQRACDTVYGGGSPEHLRAGMLKCGGLVDEREKYTTCLSKAFEQ